MTKGSHMEDSKAEWNSWISEDLACHWEPRRSITLEVRMRVGAHAFDFAERTGHKLHLLQSLKNKTQKKKITAPSQTKQKRPQSEFNNGRPGRHLPQFQEPFWRGNGERSQSGKENRLKESLTFKYSEKIFKLEKNEWPVIGKFTLLFFPHY